MGIDSVSTTGMIHGSFTLAFVVISILLGLRILMNYFQYKDIKFITVGLTWILMSSGWWGSTISFILLLFFDQMLDTTVYFFLGYFFIPLAISCWMFSFSKMVYPDITKLFVGIYLIITIIWEIYLITSLIIDPSLIGTIKEDFNQAPTLIPTIFLIFCVITACITGILFARKTLESDDEKIRLKGKFLFIAFVSFTIGAFLDAALPLSPIGIVIIRLILISSAVEYYFGFLLPDRIAQILLKKDKTS